MQHHTELSFIDEFRRVSPLHYLKNGWQHTVLLRCMLQVGPPALHYYCAVVLHSCIVLPPPGHSSNHQYHCCQLTRQSSCVSKFYSTFKVFIWLSPVHNLVHQKIHIFNLHIKWFQKQYSLMVVKFVDILHFTINDFNLAVTPWWWHSYAETCQSKLTIALHIISAFCWYLIGNNLRKISDNNLIPQQRVFVSYLID